MTKLDVFTKNRLIRFVDSFRQQAGQLPTLQDFEKSGIDRTTVELAVKEKVLEQFYVTLTSGTVVKGFKTVDSENII